MKYNLSTPNDTQKAFAYLNKLKEKGAKIELKEIRKKRSNQQNRYLHLTFSWFGAEKGYTEHEVKQGIFKQIVNPKIFMIPILKDGHSFVIIRSTADLDSKELSLAIERFRNWCSIEHGIYIPEANEYEKLDWIEQELQKDETHL